MFVGIDQKGQRVFVENAKKEEMYFCPICNGKLHIREGEVNTKHFAHVSLETCDDFSSDMSEWHRKWQEQFPMKNREVIISHKGEVHRADVLAYGYVVEFQHSSISAEEFNRRNSFYISAGYKVIWIFDLSEEWQRDSVECYDEWDGRSENGGKYSWKHPRRFMKNLVPQFEKKIILFFQLQNTTFENDEEESYMERVTWAIHNEGESDFRRFITSYYPGTRDELLEWMSEKKL